MIIEMKFLDLLTNREIIVKFPCDGTPVKEQIFLDAVTDFVNDGQPMDEATYNAKSFTYRAWNELLDILQQQLNSTTP